VFEVESDTYCYELEFESLIDGTRLGPFAECVPHGDLGAIGVFELTPSELATELTFCSEPPPGYESDWCEVFAEECAATGSAGTDGIGGASMDPHDGEMAGAGGAVADDGTPERLVRTEGACLCGVAGRSHEKPRLAYAALALLGVAAIRRRRRSS
jgi:MYXO-CTERM domain-containing protein